MSMTDREIGHKLREMWEDQRAFNLLFRPQPDSETMLSEQVRDFTLYTESELHELCRTLPWKKHRRVPVPLNEAHMHEEGTDVFKCVLSILQIIGIDSLERVIEEYWRKTAVVRQRYQEEWITKVDRSCVVIDIDNVLCDYIGGMCEWLPSQFEVPDDSASPELLGRINRIKRTGEFINARSLGIPDDSWQKIKHAFRVGGFKRKLPVFPDAFTFMYRMRADGHLIVLLTSRPIDRYPNIFTDTILWLNDNHLPYDFVWWATDKAERIAQVDGFKQHILFAVDDDWRYVQQFASAGIHTYWLQRYKDARALSAPENITIVNSLMDVDRY